MPKVEKSRVQALVDAYKDHLHYDCLKTESEASDWDRYLSLAVAVRKQFTDRWLACMHDFQTKDCKHVYYLSFEYLMGRLMENNILNLQMMEEVREACKEIGIDFDHLKDVGEDAGLGNGGLGRLAACFLDSLASLGYPAMGYGIRYQYGIFRQHIEDGAQREEPDDWLKHGNPWERPMPNDAAIVKFGGRVIPVPGSKTGQCMWVDTQDIQAMPYDVPVVGWQGATILSLRLWSSQATSDFNLEEFNKGDYLAAVEAKNEAERISKVLYPNDNNYEGKELRFKQQFFFVSASVQDLIRRFKAQNGTRFHLLPEKCAIQLNDTHPALTILELMRILIDEEGLTFAKAFQITRKTCAYTNHTLMPEALEKWSVELFEKLLPRHLLIMYDINSEFLRDVTLKFQGDLEKIISMSLFEEGAEKMARMGYLSVVGSHSTNGVAALHSKLLVQDLFQDFAQVYPKRFNNKTNGVTPRKWLLHCNPELAELITSKIGKGWICDMDRLREFGQFAKDRKVLKELERIKLGNKILLKEIIRKELDLEVSEHSMFDVQIKRIHEYKRQLLNILHVIMMYNRLKKDGNALKSPMTVIFGGKAAPGYFNAKLIIHLINSVARFINEDPETNDKLKVLFMPNYRVTLAERLFPATDLSEQISTASTEASGTGNMKFAMNGALTLGTMDGANVEMAEEMGEENMFIFGLRTEEVLSLRESEEYSPWDIYNENEEIRNVLDMVRNGFFSPENRDLFEPLTYTLLQKGDYYFLLKDLMDYDRARMEANKAYADKDTWYSKTCINISSMGKFSSDRTIREYANDIWKATPFGPTAC